MMICNEDGKKEHWRQILGSRNWDFLRALSLCLQFFYIGYCGIGDGDVGVFGGMDWPDF